MAEKKQTNKKQSETIPRGEARKIHFKKMNLSAAAKNELRACLGVPDDAAELAFLLIERAFRAYRESNMNPDFKPAARADVERKIHALRAALSAVQKCPASLQSLDWVYVREHGKAWTDADMPAALVPDIRQAMIEITGSTPPADPGRFKNISVLEMLPRILKTCELTLKPAEVWTGYYDSEKILHLPFERDAAGNLIGTKTKKLKSCAAAFSLQQRGNPGLSSGEIGFADSMANIFEGCGHTFTQQQNKGFDQFLRCVFSALDPAYPEEANHSALLKAVAAKRKRATLKAPKKQH